MASVWAELKRRNVVKVAVAYAIVGWILIEISATVFPIVQLPEWTVTFVTMLVLLGFPVALVLSWAYEMTPDGLKPSHEVDQSASITHVTGRKIDFIIIGLMAVGIGYLILDNYVLVDETDAVVQEPEAPSVEEVLPEPAPPVIAEEHREVLPNSVAVLPFENLSPDPDNAYFAAGIHEEVLNHLVKIRDLSVIARTSVLKEAFSNGEMSIPEIAAELNVQSVVEGSVRYAGDRVRITTQLIDAASGAHLWSEVYERSLADIFAVQSDIAERIAAALEVELLPEEQQRIERLPTSSPEAYSLYLQARDLLNRTLQLDLNELDAAAAMLDQAIKIDPDFADAYRLRATQRWLLIGRVSIAKDDWEDLRLEQERLATQELQRALELDPNLGSAYAMQSLIHQSNWRAGAARRTLEAALRLSPNDTGVLWQYAMFNGLVGQPDMGLNLIERALELTANAPVLHHFKGIILNYAGDAEAAYASFRKAAEILNLSKSYLELGFLEVRRGNPNAALAEFMACEAAISPSLLPQSAGHLAYGYSLAGSTEDAKRLAAIHQENTTATRVDPINAAYSYLAIGDQEQALHWLEEAVGAWRVVLQAVTMVHVNIYQDPVLDQPEFVEVRGRLGFTDL